MSTLTTTQLATLPQVNLLPPEIEQARRFRHLQMGLGGAVIAALAVVGGLMVAASAQVGQAQDDLDTNRAQAAQLQTKVDAFAEVPLVYGQVEAARAQLGQAMGREIRWSFLLNDLSLKIPNRVWLTSMTATETEGPAAVPVDGQFAASGIGNIAFDGSAYSHNDVAAWLNALARQKGFTQPYFTNSTLVKKGTSGDAVTFTSQVTLTEDALSKRYTEKAGN